MLLNIKVFSLLLVFIEMANSETLNNDHKSEISRDLKEKMLRNDVYGLVEFFQLLRCSVKSILET